MRLPSRAAGRFMYKRLENIEQMDIWLWRIIGFADHTFFWGELPCIVRYRFQPDSPGK